MDGGTAMDHFIARENIKHFRDRLWTESDPNMRSRVHELLIAEEDKLAAAHADSALLADIEQHISDGDRRIERQRVRVASMHSDGHGGLALAQSLLDGMIESNDLHKQYRAHLLAKIRENPLSS